MTPSRYVIPKFQGYHCFACGSENPIGLNMSFYAEGDEVCSDVNLGPHFVGWENISHGGIISCMHDEVMAWTILYFKRTFCVTREITTKFIKPVPVGVPLNIRGQIIESKKKYSCRVGARILDEDSTLLSSAEADFALLREEQMALLPEKVREDMSAFFQKLESENPFE